MHDFSWRHYGDRSFLRRQTPDFRATLMDPACGFRKNYYPYELHRVEADSVRLRMAQALSPLFEQEATEGYDAIVEMTDDFSVRHVPAPADPSPQAVVSDAPYHPLTWRIRDQIDTDLMREALYDPHYGHVRHVYKDLSSFDIAIVGAEFSTQDTISFAYGRGSTFKRAEQSCWLEYIERQSMYGLAGSTRRARFDRTDERFIDPTLFLHYQAPDSTGFRQSFREDAYLEWWPVTDYRNGQTRYLPRQMFDLIPPKHEPVFYLPNSSGVALGSSVAEARLFALFELIERDAFLTFWQKKVRLFQIDPISLTDKQQALLRAFGDDQTQVFVFDMTFDIPLPCVLVLVLSEKGPVHTYISTAAHPDPLKAVDGALDEALVGFRVYQSNDELPRRQYRYPHNVRELFDHVCYAAKQTFADEYRYLFDDPRCYRLEELYPPQARALFHRHRSAAPLLDDIIHRFFGGKDIYFADLSDGLAGTFGLYVQKAMVSRFGQMSFGYDHRQVDEERLDEAVRESRYRRRALCAEGDYYDGVHPYA